MYVVSNFVTDADFRRVLTARNRKGALVQIRKLFSSHGLKIRISRDTIYVENQATRYHFMWRSGFPKGQSGQFDIGKL